MPTLASPLGPNSSLASLHSLDPHFIFTTVLCLSFATLAVIVRLAVNLSGPNRKLRVGDYTALISLLGLFATCVTAIRIWEVHEQHRWHAEKDDTYASLVEGVMKLIYFMHVCYSPTILAAKLTILLQLTRIFVTTKRGLVFRLIQISIWSNVCFYLGNTLSAIFTCTPVSKAWNISSKGHCIAKNVNQIAAGSINILSDALIFILPLWIIWHLKMPIVKRVSVSVVFAAGVFANFAGIMRLVFCIRVFNQNHNLRAQHKQTLWTIAEIATAIMCASLPLVPKFLRLLHQQYSKLTSSATRPRLSRTPSLNEPRPPPVPPKPFVERDVAKRDGFVLGRNKQATATNAYESADEELAPVRPERARTAVVSGRQGPRYGRMERQQGIRKTIEIEQSY